MKGGRKFAIDKFTQHNTHTNLQHIGSTLTKSLTYTPPRSPQVKSVDNSFSPPPHQIALSNLSNSSFRLTRRQQPTENGREIPHQQEVPAGVEGDPGDQRLDPGVPDVESLRLPPCLCPPRKTQGG